MINTPESMLALIRDNTPRIKQQNEITEKKFELSLEECHHIAISSGVLMSLTVATSWITTPLHLSERTYVCEVHILHIVCIHDPIQHCWMRLKYGPDRTNGPIDL